MSGAGMPTMRRAHDVPEQVLLRVVAQRVAAVEAAVPAAAAVGVVIVAGGGLTARKSLISTGREPPVCTGFPTGTAPPVLRARALSTGQLVRY